MGAKLPDNDKKEIRDKLERLKERADRIKKQIPKRKEKNE